MHQCRAAAAGRQGDDRFVEPDVLRVDDLVGLPVFEHAVLVDSRRVGEGVASDDRLVGLHGHVHQARHQMRGLGDELRVDARVDVEFAVAAQRHHHLFERGVARPFADAVDRYLGLSGAVENGAQRVGRRHAQIVVAVGGDDRTVDVGDVFDQIADLRSVLLRQAVARRVGDVDHRGAGRNGRFDHAGEVFGFGPAGVFGVELHVFDIAFGVFYRVDSRFEYLFGRRTQFVVDVLGRDADTGVDPLVPGQPQGVGRYVDVLAYGARERADRRLGDGLRNFEHGVEVSWAGDRESRLDDVHAEAFQQLGDLDLFDRVQLAAGNLLAVAERGVENVQSLTHILSVF